LAFISVLMLTTIGDWALAMLRNVSASIGPPMGALFIAGTAIVWAAEAGVSSSREAITSATANEATAVNST
jgi:hypothetical protein